MNFGGETIQLSLGPAANAVTSHLCNLQGLASTTSSSFTDSGTGTDTSSLPLCDPYVTHAVQNDIYVPRVLIVDAKNHFSPWPVEVSIDSSTRIDSSLSGWNGKVEVHQRVPIYNQQSTTASMNSNSSNGHVNDSGMIPSHSSFVDANVTSFTMNQLNPIQRNAMDRFQKTIATSSTSFSSSNNRYHSSKYQHVSSQYVYSSTATSSNGRYMDWGDEDEEEEEEEDEYYKARKQQLERQRWNQYETEVHDEINHSWNTFFTGIEQPQYHQQQQNENKQYAAAAAAAASVGIRFDNRMNHNHPNSNKTTAESSTIASMATNSSTKEETDGKSQYQDTKNSNSVLHHLQWRHYFMPPHPNSSMYSAPLPFDHILNTVPSSSSLPPSNGATYNKSNQSIMYSHYCGKYPSSSSSQNSMGDAAITNEWRDELSDKIRKWMEDCDALKGIQIVIDNDKSLYGGLATSILEELNDECKSAGKFSILLHDGNAFDHSLGGEGADNDNNDNSYWRSERKVVDSFRSHLNDGLNLHGIGENSDLVVPLSLTKCWNSLHPKERSDRDMTLFEASAVAALALESMTLSYRLLKDSSRIKRSKIGIMNGYYQGLGQSDDNDAFPTVNKLSFHEFLSSQRPSNSHTMLEVSTCMEKNDLNSRLLQGTSVERRKLEEERERNRNSRYYRRGRARDVDPGLWLEDSNNGGLMSPLFPIDEKSSSRSMHRHFTMSSSLRPNEAGSMTDIVSTNTTLIMEGMGIRLRPQSSVSTIVGQSLSDLTNSKSYAAGSYWKSIFSNGIQDVPVLTIVGNSTRLHSHLNSTSKNMSQALSRRYQGYLSRDSMAGIVPEQEDCTDALEHCLNLRDTYEPPMMFDDEEGSYFEDNSD